MQATTRRQSVQNRGPIESDVDGGQNEIESSRRRFDFFVIGRIEGFVRAQLFGFLDFIETRCKRRHFAAPVRQKLQRDMSQTADANHRDFVGRFHVAHHDGLENRDAAAKHRAEFARVQLGGNRNRPRPMRAHFLRETAETPDNRAFEIGTQILIAAQTPLARHTRTGNPAQTNAVANLEFFSGAPDVADGADDFVAGHKRILRLLPVVFSHRQIGVADAAILDINFNFLGAEFGHFVLERFERRASGWGGESFNFGHRFKHGQFAVPMRFQGKLILNLRQFQRRIIGVAFVFIAAGILVKRRRIRLIQRRAGLQTNR